MADLKPVDKEALKQAMKRIRVADGELLEARVALAELLGVETFVLGPDGLAVHVESEVNAVRWAMFSSALSELAAQRNRLEIRS